MGEGTIHAGAHDRNARPPEDGGQESIDVRLLWNFLRRHWLALGLCATVSAILAVALSFHSARIYRAEATVEPVSGHDAMGGLAGLSSQLGALPSLLGVQIGGAGRSTEASLAVLQSRPLLTQFIVEEQLMPIVFADRWDSEKKLWRKGWHSDDPTVDDAYEVITHGVLSARENPKTGLIVVAVEWQDRVVAARWVNALINRANTYIAAQAAAEADRHVEYLNEELKRADQLELRQAIFSLIEAEVKNRMLARTKVEFAFRVLDPAAPPPRYRYVKPVRVLYAIGGFIFGGLCAALWAIRRDRKR